jgi:hypothetical protein
MPYMVQAPIKNEHIHRRCTESTALTTPQEFSSWVGCLPRLNIRSNWNGERCSQWLLSPFPLDWMEADCSGQLLMPSFDGSEMVIKTILVSLTFAYVTSPNFGTRLRCLKNALKALVYKHLCYRVQGHLPVTYAAPCLAT